MAFVCAILASSINLQRHECFMALMNLQFGTVTIRSKCFIHSSIFHHFFSGIKWLILPNIFCNSFALINSYDLA